MNISQPYVRQTVRSKIRYERKIWYIKIYIILTILESGWKEKNIRYNVDEKAEEPALTEY